MTDRRETERAALATLCQFEVLSRQEEQRLFGRLKAVRAKALRLGGRTSVRTTCRPRAAKTVLTGEAAGIRNRIVESNLRLVVSVAKGFAGPERPLEDLVSEAALPLIRCVESFDPERGTRFSTYATRALKNFFGKLRRQDVRRRSRFLSRPSLRSAAAENGSPPLFERLIEAEDLSRLGGRLARLPVRERTLVVERFGLTGARRPLTFRELGEKRGLSKERVRIITSEAMARLRESFDESPPP